MTRLIVHLMVDLIAHLIVDLMVDLIVDLAVDLVVDLMVNLMVHLMVGLTVSDISVLLSLTIYISKWRSPSKTWPNHIKSTTQISITMLLISVMF